MRLLRNAVTPARTASALILTMVAICLAAFAPSASAAIAPTLTLDQSAGTTAGAYQNLGLDITFQAAGSTSDTPKTLSITLPRGLLASAALDNGACLQWTGSGSATPPAACQVGTGTADATATISILPVQTSVSLTYYLVAPPSPGDLAGLYVTGTNALLGNLGQIGSTGDITVGQNVSSLNIALGLPNSVDGLSSYISSIDSTFDGIRYPSTCPSTPENVQIDATSYDDSTVQTASAPLTVTGCSTMPFAPTYSATVTKDASDDEVGIQTDIKEPETASVIDAPSSSIALVFPKPTLLANAMAAQKLCANVASGTCTPFGSATATSPLYPTSLTGTAYLTGSLKDLQLTLVFPAPFPITLTGTADLATNSVAFTGLPDIPLSDLEVTLNGGQYSPFLVDCSDPTGTSTASFTSQAGATASASTAVSVAGCPATTTHPTKKVGKPTLSKGHFSGLAQGKAAAAFTVTAGTNAAALRTITISKIYGLTFHIVKVHGKKTVKGIKLSGAKLKSAKVVHGKLVLTLKKASRKFTVQLTRAALTESSHLHWRSSSKGRKDRLKKLRLTVAVTNSTGKSTTLHETVKKLGL